MSSGLKRGIAYDELVELVERRKLSAMRAALAARMRYGRL
jgi:hypothetical protein